MKNIFVFKTSVTQHKEITQLKPALNALLQAQGKWNFDLEDCDNILRVETSRVPSVAIETALKGYGFCCEELY